MTKGQGKTFIGLIDFSGKTEYFHNFFRHLRQVLRSKVHMKNMHVQLISALDSCFEKGPEEPFVYIV